MLAQSELPISLSLWGDRPLQPASTVPNLLFPSFVLASSLISRLGHFNTYLRPDVHLSLTIRLVQVNFLTQGPPRPQSHPQSNLRQRTLPLKPSCIDT